MSWAVKRTCDECPWRRDVPLGRFKPERYHALADTCDRHFSGFPQPVFACHKTERSEKACAGFLMVVGFDNITVRLAAMYDKVDLSEITADGPLYDSFVAMAAANGAVIATKKWPP